MITFYVLRLALLLLVVVLVEGCGGTDIQSDRYPRGSEHHVYIANDDRPLKPVSQLEVEATAAAAARCATYGEQAKPVRTVGTSINSLTLLYRCEP